MVAQLLETLCYSYSATVQQRLSEIIGGGGTIAPLATITLTLILPNLALLLFIQVKGWSLNYYSQWLDEHESEKERMTLIR
jgi:hypothetical protein